MSLRKKLASYGFESNDDYEFALRCLFDAELPHLRVLHVDGAGGRRKTAFATALAHALEYPHILYHDFSREEPPPVAIPVVLEDGSAGPSEPGPTAFDRAITEACAYSEGSRCILILDQLQAADFADHIRLYELGTTREWSGVAGTVRANPRNLLVVLISEQPLYHSLAKISYRVWTDAQRAYLDYRPEDYGLGPDAKDLFAALAALFEAAHASPTPREFERLLLDLLHRVRSEDQLRQVVFGWTEAVERERLYSPEVTPKLQAAVDALTRYLGSDEVEL
jgi:hypothetical protein